MEFTTLEAPITDGAIRTVNFFNGRLLTGADLAREQRARREALALLGQAQGDGVAHGLHVRHLGNIAPGGRPAARVEAGLAINRQGQALALARPVTLALDRTAPPSAAARACLFGDCAPLATGDYVAGAGLFLLTIAPAFADEGRAAVSGMGDAPGRCAIDATAEAVQFRLIEVRPEVHRVNFAAANLRNALAYRCLGDGVAATWPIDLAGAEPRQDDLLEEMRDHGLSDAEVPLALIAFAGATGHRFTDNWAVRRSLARRPDDSVVASIVDPRRRVLGEAMLRQFQDELTDQAATAGPIARNRFVQLPPVGLLPGLTDSQITAFFAGMTLRGPLHIDASAVEPLIAESLVAPAMATAGDHAIWLYRVAQGRRDGATPLAIFASGHLPPRAEARFDLGHFDYANYALIP
jgi:hypothetical protein